MDAMDVMGGDEKVPTRHSRARRRRAYVARVAERETREGARGERVTATTRRSGRKRNRDSFIQSFIQSFIRARCSLSIIDRLNP